MDISHGIISRDHVSVINPIENTSLAMSGKITENLIISTKSEVL